MRTRRESKPTIHVPKEYRERKTSAAPNTLDKDISDTMPDGKWHVNEDCTRAFDNMLERSIPDYDKMRRLCFKIGRRFVKPGEQILDLGCSKGEALAPFVLEFGSSNHYVGVEVSAPMLEAARSRFRDVNEVEIVNLDLRNEFPQGSNCLILSVLTLQFIPINYRQRILRQIHEHLSRDSALILVEKVLGNTAIIDDLLVETYHEMKMSNGYSMDEVERKKLALEGVLVPLTAQINEQFLHNAGFVQVDAFWRTLNFCAWVAVK